MRLLIHSLLQGPFKTIEKETAADEQWNLYMAREEKDPG